MFCSLVRKHMVPPSGISLNEIVYVAETKPQSSVCPTSSTEMAAPSPAFRKPDST